MEVNMLNMHVDLSKYALKWAAENIQNKIIESAKLIEQFITIFLKGIVHPKIKVWCSSAYRKGIQDVGDFVSSVEHKLIFLTQTIAVCQSYNWIQWDSQLWEKKKHTKTKPNETLWLLMISVRFMIFCLILLLKPWFPLHLSPWPYLSPDSCSDSNFLKSLFLLLTVFFNPCNNSNVSITFPRLLLTWFKYISWINWYKISYKDIAYICHIRLLTL